MYAFTGGADMFHFLRCITTTLRGTVWRQIVCRSFWRVHVSAPQNNSPTGQIYAFHVLADTRECNIQSNLHRLKITAHIHAHVHIPK